MLAEENLWRWCLWFDKSACGGCLMWVEVEFIGCQSSVHFSQIYTKCSAHNPTHMTKSKSIRSNIPFLFSKLVFKVTNVKLVSGYQHKLICLWSLNLPLSVGRAGLWIGNCRPCGVSGHPPPHIYPAPPPQIPQPPKRKLFLEKLSFHLRLILIPWEIVCSIKHHT